MMSIRHFRYEWTKELEQLPQFRCSDHFFFVDLKKKQRNSYSSFQIKRTQTFPICLNTTKLMLKHLFMAWRSRRSTTHRLKTRWKKAYGKIPMSNFKKINFFISWMKAAFQYFSTFSLFLFDIKKYTCVNSNEQFYSVFFLRRSHEKNWNNHKNIAVASILQQKRHTEIEYCRKVIAREQKNPHTSIKG